METKLTQRYEPNAVNWLMGVEHVMHMDPDGSFVLYEEHLRQVALLEMQVVNLQQELDSLKRHKA